MVAMSAMTSGDAIIKALTSPVRIAETSSMTPTVLMSF